jgi:hypothetical protein
MDVWGVVDATGEGAAQWLGKRVVAITKMALGGIPQYAIAPGVSVFDAPEQFDDAEATAFVLTFQTSHLALFRRGRLRAGETPVIHSAASGLGSAGIQVGKAAGASVIAVAGGPAKGERAAAGNWPWDSRTTTPTGDRPSPAHGLHRQYRHRRRHAGLKRRGRPRQAAVRLQPVRARRRRRGPQ